jgi:hypothetical protein
VQKIKAKIERRGPSMDVSPVMIMTIVRMAAGPVFIQRSCNVQRMHICTTGISVGGNVGSFPQSVAEFSQNPRN